MRNILFLLIVVIAISSITIAQNVEPTQVQFSIDTTTSGGTPVQLYLSS